ncbi:MAG: hypothetical protein HQK51_05200 [Oligoflexia bacterium]|nr:hypothetical protein [Oligoflexia bacterium]
MFYHLRIYLFLLFLFSFSFLLLLGLSNLKVQAQTESKIETHIPKFGIASNSENLAKELYFKYQQFLSSKAFDNYSRPLMILADYLHLSGEQLEMLLQKKGCLFLARSGNVNFIMSNGKKILLKKGDFLSQEQFEQILQQLSWKQRDLLLTYLQSDGIVRNKIYSNNSQLFNSNFAKLFLNCMPLVVESLDTDKNRYFDQTTMEVNLSEVSIGSRGNLKIYLAPLKAIIGLKFNQMEFSNFFRNNLNSMIKQQKIFLDEIKNTIRLQIATDKKHRLPEMILAPSTYMSGAAFIDKSFQLSYAPFDFPLYTISKEQLQGKEFLLNLFNTFTHEIRHSEQWLWALWYCKNVTQSCYYLEEPKLEADPLIAARPDVHDQKAFRKKNQQWLEEWAPPEGFAKEGSNERELAKKFWERYQIGGSLLKESKPIDLPKRMKISWATWPTSLEMIKDFYKVYWKIRFNGGNTPLKDISTTDIESLLKQEKFLAKTPLSVWMELLSYEKHYQEYFTNVFQESDAFSVEQTLEKYLRILLSLPEDNSIFEKKRFKDLFDHRLMDCEYR